MDNNTRVFLKYVDTLQSICKVKGYKNAKDWVSKGKDCKLNMSEKVHLLELVNNRNTIAHQGININVSKSDIDFLYKIIESTGYDMKLLKVYSTGNNNEKKQPKKQDKIFHLVLYDRVLDIDLSEIKSVEVSTEKYYKDFSDRYEKPRYFPVVIINSIHGEENKVPLNYTYFYEYDAIKEGARIQEIILKALKKYKLNK